MRLFFKSSILFLFSTLISCQNEINDLTMGSSAMEAVAERKVFSDFKEYFEFIKTVSKEDKTGSFTKSIDTNTDVSIVESFLRTTPLGNVFNSNKEFQIGDTIVKLGESGYATYKILLSKYSKALQLITNEDDIIFDVNADKYREIGESMHEIEDGIFIEYTGDPIIKKNDLPLLSEEILENHIVTKSSGINPYEVKAKFWSSSLFFYSGCGTEIYYKERNSKGKMVDYNTNLRMTWIKLCVYQDKALLPYPNGRKDDTGSYDKKTFFESGGINIPKYEYAFGSIVGEAKHSSGVWVRNVFGTPVP